MRILQFKTSAGRGGAETLVLQLTARFRERGHTVRTLVAEEGWLVSRMEESGLNVGFPSQIGSRHLNIIAMAVRCVKSFRPDVILSHGARVNLLACICSRISRTPLVTVEHNVDSWRDSSNMRNVIDRFIGMNSFARIAVSNAVRTMLIAKSILPETKIHVIPNGIEAPSSSGGAEDGDEIRERFSIAEEDFLVVTVSRLVEQKGHRFLLGAIPGILSQHPRCKFLFLGDGVMRTAIRDQIAALGISDAVRLPGAVDGVLKILRAADLFVLPSLWEGMPVALLEAMSVGLPVVATSVAGIPEIVSDRQNGMLVPHSDSEALGDAIRFMINCPDQRRALGEAGRQHVLRNFLIEQTAEGYLGLLARGAQMEA